MQPQAPDASPQYKLPMQAQHCIAPVWTKPTHLRHTEFHLMLQNHASHLPKRQQESDPQPGGPIHHTSTSFASNLTLLSCVEFGLLAGDGNCFYRAFLAATLEQLCHNPMQCRGQSLLSAFQAWYQALAAERVLILQPHYLAQVDLGYTYLKVHSPHAQMPSNSNIVIVTGVFASKT